MPTCERFGSFAGSDAAQEVRGRAGGARLSEEGDEALDEEGHAEDAVVGVVRLDLGGEREREGGRGREREIERGESCVDERSKAHQQGAHQRGAHQQGAHQQGEAV